MSLAVKRAAGAALRAVKRRGETLKPQLAIEALLAAMRERFSLAEAVSDRLLRPALADWRDAVGCADPLLLAANARAEKLLLPLPLPSWCAWLAEAGVLSFDAPVFEGPRIALHARLLVVREAELTAEETFQLVFAGRYGASDLAVHLAISPHERVPGWQGAVLLRAAARRSEGPVRIWLGAPSSPEARATGMSGVNVATWAARDVPRWAVLRLLEAREPQALLDLRTILPEAGTSAAAPSALRISADIGSTSTVIVEEDSAISGSLGMKLLPQARSGFRLLAGDPARAAAVGCAEQLLAPGGQLPTALAASGPEAVKLLLEGKCGPEQLWLPQAAEGSFLVDRFKSPELLLLSDWLTEVGAVNRAQASRALLDAYAFLLGRTLACAHAAPLLMPDGSRWPRLGSVEATLSFPECAFGTSAPEPFRAVLDHAGAELCRGLSSAWSAATHRMVPDAAAARASREQPGDAACEAFVDFGGLTLQIAVRAPHARGRPPPLIPGSSMSYLLGGERLIDAATFASASGVRETSRALARKWRALIASGGAVQPEGMEAVRTAILDTVLGLVRRQLEGTLRRAGAPLGAEVRLHLLGDGWKLLALDAPDADRERLALQRVQSQAPGFSVVRLDKRRVCEAALRAQDEAQEPSLALQGVDVGTRTALRQRWFGVVEAGRLSADLLPRAQDEWWRDFSRGGGALLRVEQWFGAGEATPLRARLAAGNLSFDPGASFLQQWIDVSGPSLVALRIHEHL